MIVTKVIESEQVWLMKSDGDGRFITAGKSDYVDLADRDLISQCEVDIYRASGPGGQKRNKTGSAVRLRHKPTGQTVTATESRSQHENRARALKRLRESIALHVRRQVSLEEYRLSDVLKSCISSASKLCVGRRDYRYNAAVWEILDVLYACEMQVSTAAGLLGISTSNLTNFLREDTALWRRVNEMRTAAGLKALK